MLAQIWHASVLLLSWSFNLPFMTVLDIPWTFLKCTVDYRFRLSLSGDILSGAWLPLAGVHDQDVMFAYSTVPEVASKYEASTLDDLTNMCASSGVPFCIFEKQLHFFVAPVTNRSTAGHSSFTENVLSTWWAICHLRGWFEQRRGLQWDVGSLHVNISASSRQSQTRYMWDVCRCRRLSPLWKHIGTLWSPISQGKLS